MWEKKPVALVEYLKKKEISNWGNLTVFKELLNYGFHEILKVFVPGIPN